MSPSIDALAGYRLDACVAAVTGGAGAIGAAIVRHLHALGARVYVLDLHEMPDAPGGVESIRCDVGDRASVESALAQIHARGARISALINCHGVQARRTLLEYTEEEWKHVLDINLTGVFRTCQVFGPDLHASGGSVVNISSIVGTVAARTGAAYGASKAALSHLTRILALEWAPTVRVNAVAPNVVESALTTELFARPDYVQKRIEAIPMRRLITSEDVAGAVGFLLSKHAGMITGQVLMVDGGFTLP